MCVFVCVCDVVVTVIAVLVVGYLISYILFIGYIYTEEKKKMQYTSHRSRLPLLEALGGSSPESSTPPDAQSVTCVRRMTERMEGLAVPLKFFESNFFTPFFFVHHP